MRHGLNVPFYVDTSDYAVMDTVLANFQERINDTRWLIWEKIQISGTMSRSDVPVLFLSLASCKQNRMILDRGVFSGISWVMTWVLTRFIAFSFSRNTPQLARFGYN